MDDLLECEGVPVQEISTTRDDDDDGLNGNGNDGLNGDANDGLNGDGNDGLNGDVKDDNDGKDVKPKGPCSDSEDELHEKLVSFVGVDTVTSVQDPEPSLVNIYHDLLLLAEKMTARIEEYVSQEVNLDNRKRAAREPETEDEDEGEDEDDDDEDEEKDTDVDATEDDSDGENVRKKSKKKSRAKLPTQLEELLGVLQLHKSQKQNIVIKRAILLNCEEKMFGNNNITMTIDLRHVGEDKKSGKLENILQCKDLVNYLPKNQTNNGNVLELADKAVLRELVSTAQQPADILSHLSTKTPKSVGVNLILQQFNIRWNTSSGESRTYDFYSLPKHFVKGAVRKAYTQILLYEHKSVLANLATLFGKHMDTILKPKHFCPPCAYVKKHPYALYEGDSSGLPVRQRNEPKYSWQSWTFNNPCPDTSTSQDVPLSCHEFPVELQWMSPKVKLLMKKLCEPIPDDFNPESTANIMYALVVNETMSTKMLETGYKSQVYIGSADNGLKERFMGEEDSHCARLFQLQKHFSEAEYFVPFQTGLLVEMRLLLAMARKENYALFVLKECESPRMLGREVHDLITKALWLSKEEVWGPAVNMNFGLNMKEELKKKRKFLPDSFPGSRRKKSK